MAGGDLRCTDWGVPSYLGVLRYLGAHLLVNWPPVVSTVLMGRSRAARGVRRDELWPAHPDPGVCILTRLLSPALVTIRLCRIQVRLMLIYFTPDPSPALHVCCGERGSPKEYQEEGGEGKRGKGLSFTRPDIAVCSVNIESFE